MLFDVTLLTLDLLMLGLLWESHNGAIPPLKFEILKKFPGDPALRQATEAVSIRRNKPKWNGKEEWSNEPRKTKRPSISKFVVKERKQK